MTQHDTATSKTFLKVTLQILYMRKYIKLKKKKIEKEKAGSTMLRIRTLDLETSPSALPAAQGTNKCGSISVREDSNLILHNIATKWSSNTLERQISLVKIQTSDFAISILNALPAELRKKCGSTFVRICKLTVWNEKFWSIFHKDSNLRSTDFAVKKHSCWS